MDECTEILKRVQKICEGTGRCAGCGFYSYGATDNLNYCIFETTPEEFEFMEDGRVKRC